MSDTATAIPVIDLAPLATGGAPAWHATADAVDKACREIGFFTVLGHGVDEDLVAAVRAQAVEFFALPPMEKMKVQRPPQRISRGYFSLGERSLSYSLGIAAPPDLQEAFAFGPEGAAESTRRMSEGAAAMLAPNLWPDRPAGFKHLLTEYYRSMSDLGARMMRLMAQALALDQDFFADKFAHESSIARLIRYPALAAAPLAGQLRAGAHSDYGTVTFVRGDDTPGGLQVKRRDGTWIDVHPAPNSFVCNIGDLMMRWSNDRWVSTLHRVAVPEPTAVPSDRISLVFFHMPNPDAVIRCIAAAGAEKYPPITCAEHYLGKLMKAAHRRLDATMQDAVTGAG
jgi:isopenicillin N synthase-like dioxygenase